MDDERILDNAVLRLDNAPEGRGLRVHESADWLTADVLTVLNQRRWIEWRQWCRSDSGPRPYLNKWNTEFVHDWASFLAEYPGDISPEIRLWLKGKSRAAEVRLACDDGQGGERAARSGVVLGLLHEQYVAPIIVGIVLLVIVGVAVWKWPWIKEFLG